MGGGDAGDDMVPGRLGAQALRFEELGRGAVDAEGTEVVAAHWGGGGVLWGLWRIGVGSLLQRSVMWHIIIAIASLQSFQIL